MEAVVSSTNTAADEDGEEVSCGGAVIWTRFLIFYRWPILLPDSSARTFWELLGLVFIVIELIALPYRQVFQVQAAGVFATMEDVIVYFFLTDVMLNLCTAYYNQGHLISDPEKIIRNYMKGWFLIDVLASFPYSWAFPDTGSDGMRILRILRFSRFFKVLRLLKVAKLKELFAKLEESSSSLFIASFMIRMTRVLLVLVLLAHFSACTWYFIAIQQALLTDECEAKPWTEGCLTNSWLNSVTIADDEPHPKFKLYIHSVYFSMATMTTVGYGDVYPVSPKERLFCVFFFLLSIVAFSAVVGSVGEVFQSFSRMSQEQKAHMARLAVYAKWRRLPHQTYIKMKQYAKYVFEVNEGMMQNEQEILAMISPALRHQCCNLIFASALRPAPFLTWVSQHEIAFEILLVKAKGEIHAPGDILFHVGQVGSKMYALTEGTITVTDIGMAGMNLPRETMKLLDPNAFSLGDLENKRSSTSGGSGGGKTPSKVLEAPSHFGGTVLMALVDPMPIPAPQLRPFTIVSETHTQFAAIDVEDIRDVMERFSFLQEDLENWLDLDEINKQRETEAPKQMSMQQGPSAEKPSDVLALKTGSKKQEPDNGELMKPGEIQAEMSHLQEKMDSLLREYRKLQSEEENISSRMARREMNRHATKFRGMSGYLKTSAAVLSHQIKSTTRHFL
jgi:hypothetical protein